ncbi:MAG: hypothetical protein IMF11_19710 [Proteobacteria bacterium]|nr:hypothetical protein [Pseudomonadota bacterium]
MKDSKLWKIYWWGNHRDDELIRYLEMDSRLKDITKPGLFGRGFQKANQKYESKWLREYEELPAKKFQRYGILDRGWLVEVPQKVERRGVREVYEGSRLLIKRGITEKTFPKGKIIARIERDRFSFRHSIYGVKLVQKKEWHYKCILGILWSSLARYYFFLTSSAWGGVASRNSRGRVTGFADTISPKRGFEERNIRTC